MLSDSDVHRLAGHLFLSTMTDDVEVILGDRIEDEAAGSKRDVDIVMMSSAGTLLSAAEVKNHARPLDTPVVEGLCQKLNDMSGFTNRRIVSTSGYSAPALRKAEAHGIECLRIKSGQLPNLDHVDFSGLTHIDVSNRRWIEADIRLLPATDLSPSVREHLMRVARAPETLVEIGETTLTMSDLGQRILNASLARLPEHEGPEVQRVALTVELDHPVDIQVDGDRHSFTHVDVQGSLEITQSKVALDTAQYLVGPDDKPVSACVLAEIHGNLVGLLASPLTRTINAFRIPPPVRDKRRPYKERLR